MSQASVGLSHLINEVKETLEQQFLLQRWVVAEISEMNTNRSGHCYLELIEKDALSDKIIAKSRATIWAFVYRMLKPYFESSTGETLRSGLKVLLKVSVEFHEVYGFSLNVQDIDPQYTLGDIAQKRARIIQKLEADGVIDMNKELKLSLAPQHLAVISSETAAGYGDFKDQLQNNKHGFDFQLQLFPALMQGEKAPQSIINALDLIYEQGDAFDAVVLIRGGGSKSDLSCFDDYDLAYYITQFPIPVLTGIGHERDDTVSDMVAHTKLKTPTALAEFLIDGLENLREQLLFAVGDLNALVEQYFEKKLNHQNDLRKQLVSESKSILQWHASFLDKANFRVASGVRQYLKSKQHNLETNSSRLKAVSHTALHAEENLMELRGKRIKKWLGNYFSRQQRKLEFFESKVELVKPENVMKRGFAIVSSEKGLLKQADGLKPNDKLHIQLYKGKLSASVDEVLHASKKASE